MAPNVGDTQKIELYCPMANKQISIIQKYCEIFSTHEEEKEYLWINEICLYRFECQKLQILCRYNTRDLPGVPDPFKESQT